MADYAGFILVQDSSGLRFKVHEYRSQRFFSEARRFVLETGERVRRLDFDNYLHVTTGKQLTRVVPPGAIRSTNHFRRHSDPVAESGS